MADTTVVIEGSLSPSGHLARGERAEVQLTPHIQRLIDGGFVNVISYHEPTPEPFAHDSVPDQTPPPEVVPEAPKPPHKGASTAVWRHWLDTQEPPVAYPLDAGRDDLVSLWETHEAGEQVPDPAPATSGDAADSSQ